MPYFHESNKFFKKISEPWIKKNKNPSNMYGHFFHLVYN